MEYSDTKHLAQDIGLAGTEPLQNNFASVVFYTMKTPMPVIGHKTLLDVKSIVSQNSKMVSYYKSFKMPLRCSKETINFSALCKDDANGNVPLGKSCNRYWACQGGYPRLQRCPAMLVFDKQRKRCVAPPTADCDVPPTPPPSDDDEENGGDDGRPVR